MGRTNATVRDLLRHTEREWGDFRRALRRRDQAHFDRLFEYARDHADAAGTLNPTDPVPAIVLSIVLAQERERAALKERVDELEATLAELDTHALEGTQPNHVRPGPSDERE